MGILDFLEDATDYLVDTVTENPGKTALCVIAGVATGGMIYAAAPTVLFSATGSGLAANAARAALVATSMTATRKMVFTAVISLATTTTAKQICTQWKNNQKQKARSEIEALARKNASEFRGAYANFKGDMNPELRAEWEKHL